MEIKHLEVLVMPNGEILCEGKTIGMVSKLGKYLSVANKSKVTIPMTENDCEEIRNGGTFDWTFDGVDVHIKLETSCAECGEDSDDLNEDELCINCRE